MCTWSWYEHWTHFSPQYSWAAAHIRIYLRYYGQNGYQWLATHSKSFRTPHQFTAAACCLHFEVCMCVFLCLYAAGVFVMSHLFSVSFSAPNRPANQKKHFVSWETKRENTQTHGNKNEIASLLNLNGYLPTSSVSSFRSPNRSRGIWKTRLKYGLLLKNVIAKKNNNANIKYLLMAANIFVLFCFFIFPSFFSHPAQCVHEGQWNDKFANYVLQI